MGDRQFPRAVGMNKEIQQPEVDLRELLATAEDAQHKVSASSPQWRRTLMGVLVSAIFYSQLIEIPWLSISVLFFFLVIFIVAGVYGYRTRGVRQAVRGSGKPMQQWWLHDVPPWPAKMGAGRVHAAYSEPLSCLFSTRFRHRGGRYPSDVVERCVHILVCQVLGSDVLIWKKKRRSRREPLALCCWTNICTLCRGRKSVPLYGRQKRFPIVMR